MECGTYLPRSRPNLEGGGCDVVAKRYDLYFGSCKHIGTKWCLRYLYYVTMFVGPLGDALPFGDLCSVYKARCCRSSGLGKKQVSLRHREPRPHNRISVTKYSYVRLMVCDMFPTPQPPELAIYEPCSSSHFIAKIPRSEAVAQW